MEAVTIYVDAAGRTMVLSASALRLRGVGWEDQPERGPRDRMPIFGLTAAAAVQTLVHGCEDGDTLRLAKAFLGAWPDGPQL